ncbi:mex3 RNA binding family member C [Cricetulus griseus]
MSPRLSDARVSALRSIWARPWAWVGDEKDERAEEERTRRVPQVPGERGSGRDRRVAEMGHLAKNPRLARSVKFLGPRCLVAFTLIGVLVEHQAVVAPETSARYSVDTLLFSKRYTVSLLEHFSLYGEGKTGQLGCKIKALRAKTNTYIKTPVRGEEPIFVVTGRKEDVAMAKREILSAAEHFSMIRASRNKNGPALGGLSCSPNLPGQTTVQVRVPYRVVGLVVGPKGATIKRIQQQTHTYIVTPSRDKEPVFEVTGMPENVDRAREEIEMHIAMRTGNYIELNEENDFHYNGTDVSFEGGTLGSAWLSSNPVPPSRARMMSNYRNDSSSSLGSGSTDSYFGSNRLADFSPTSPFSTGNFWFGDTLPSVGSEDLAVDSPAFDSLPTSAQTIWTPFEPVNPLSGFGSDPSGNMKTQRRGSQPSTPRLSPTFPESIEHPLARRVRSDPPSTGNHVGLPIYIPAFSNGYHRAVPKHFKGEK